jgi:hypothetical protein
MRNEVVAGSLERYKKSVVDWLKEAQTFLEAEGKPDEAFIAEMLADTLSTTSINSQLKFKPRDIGY